MVLSAKGTPRRRIDKSYDESLGLLFGGRTQRVVGAVASLRSKSPPFPLFGHVVQTHRDGGSGGQLGGKVATNQ